MHSSGNHQEQREHPRQHEEFERRNSHRGERVDFLRDLHRAELRGERGSRAAGHDDRRHHRAHVAAHRDADQVGDVDRGAELLQLDRAHECENHSDQERDQRDDAEGARAAILDDDHQVDSSKARLAGGQPDERDRHFAEEAQKVVEPLRPRNRFVAKLFDERSMSDLGARAGFLGHRFGQLDKAAHALGQRGPIGGQFALVANLADAEQKREQAAVPVAQFGGVEGQASRLRRGVELFLDEVRRGQAVTKMPIAGELDNQCGVIGARERNFVGRWGLLVRLHPCGSIEHARNASTILRLSTG